MMRKKFAIKDLLDVKRSTLLVVKGEDITVDDALEVYRHSRAPGDHVGNVDVEDVSEVQVLETAPGDWLLIMSEGKVLPRLESAELKKREGFVATLLVELRHRPGMGWSTSLATTHRACAELLEWSLGPDMSEKFFRGSMYVDSMLQGAKTGAITIECMDEADIDAAGRIFEVWRDATELLGEN